MRCSDTTRRGGEEEEEDEWKSRRRGRSGRKRSGVEDRGVRKVPRKQWIKKEEEEEEDRRGS